MKTMETNRLILRAFRESDLEDFFAYASTPNVGPNAGWAPHRDRKESLRILRDLIRDDDGWAIVDKASGHVIGSLGLRVDPSRSQSDVRTLGYCLSEEYWGKGLMPEAVKRVLRFAFEEMELALVCVRHYPFNARSRRVIEKVGFTYEGCLRRTGIRYDGVVLDSMSYSMTKEEYEVLYPAGS